MRYSPQRNENFKVTIPAFNLQNTERKWGQIQTEVLSVQCAKEDAQFVKYLMSRAIERKLLQDCIFIPIGIHLMKTSEVLSNLLRQHNVFLTNTTTFDIYGLLKEIVEKKDSDDDNSIAEK